MSEYDYSGKYSPNDMERELEDTGNYRVLENNVKEMEQELTKIRSELNFAYAQMDIVKNEKEMHISQHAKEKIN